LNQWQVPTIQGDLANSAELTEVATQSQLMKAKSFALVFIYILSFFFFHQNLYIHSYLSIKHW